MSGFFITFEGGEGSGKTTQINRLSKSLAEQGHKVVTTREPGGTEEAEKIRDLLVQNKGGAWTPLAEVMLFSAARAMHVEKVIAPALDDGRIVICDRFTDSTMAYQGYGFGTDKGVIEQLNTLSTSGLQPNLTVLLNIDPEAGLGRAGRRMASEKMAVEQREDRYEQLNLDFHTRIRDGFLDIAKQNPERCVVIPADQDMDLLAEQILEAVSERLG